MAIADDFTIDYVNQRITYTGTFVSGIAPTRYTVNELYSYLQDTFDEPEQMDDPIPMSAQTPTQYTILYPWFIDYNTLKALYSGSLQTSSWAKSGAAGITVFYYDDPGSTTEPTDAEIGEVVTQAVSGATGVILKVDDIRKVVWLRNTSAAAFDSTNNCTSTTTDFDPADATSVITGEAVWSNVYSVGTLQADTEIYVAQEDDYLGGTAPPILTKITSWWDSDTDFTASTLGVAAGHFDVLIPTQEGGVWIDDLNAGSAGRLAVFARQGDTVYSHFEFAGSIGNFVVPFASTGFDINQEGFGQVLVPGSFTGTFTVGNILIGGTSGAKARLTDFVTDTSLDYILVGKDLTEFGTAAEVITEYDLDGSPTGASATKDGNPPTAINGAVAGGVTVNVGNIAVDVDENGTDEYYAVEIDCASQPLANVYQHLMYLTRRGSATGILPAPGAVDEPGEFYRGAGDAYIAIDTETVALTEGQTIEGSLSGATAELVAYYWSGAIGHLIVANVKGSFVNNDQITDEGTGDVLASAAQTSFVDVNAAPFGTFAGGRFFVARAVVLTGVPTADNNNWQTSDVTGTAFQPPTTISITFGGLASGDRAAIFEVGTASGDDIVKTTVGVTSGAVGASTVVLDANVEQDVPAAGWIRIVDESATDGTEWRMEYSSYSVATVTLRAVTAGTGTDEGAGTTTVVNSTGIGTSFGTDGKPKIGMIIRNTTDTKYSVILRAIDANNLEVTNNGTTWNTVNYTFNVLPILVDALDTCYFPYVDEVATSGTIAKSIKYAADTEIIVRARFSDPDIGGTRILPFEQKGQKIENSNLTVTAIRTEDPIAT